LWTILFQHHLWCLLLPFIFIFFIIFLFIITLLLVNSSNNNNKNNTSEEQPSVLKQASSAAAGAARKPISSSQNPNSAPKSTSRNKNSHNNSHSGNNGSGIKKKSGNRPNRKDPPTPLNALEVDSIQTVPVAPASAAVANNPTAKTPWAAIVAANSRGSAASSSSNAAFNSSNHKVVYDVRELEERMKTLAVKEYEQQLLHNSHHQQEHHIQQSLPPKIQHMAFGSMQPIPVVLGKPPMAAALSNAAPSVAVSKNGAKGAAASIENQSNLALPQQQNKSSNLPSSSLSNMPMPELFQRGPVSSSNSSSTMATPNPPSSPGTSPEEDLPPLPEEIIGPLQNFKKPNSIRKPDEKFFLKLSEHMKGLYGELTPASVELSSRNKLFSKIEKLLHSVFPGKSLVNFY
jgi:hypothetical protein